MSLTQVRSKNGLFYKHGDWLGGKRDLPFRGKPKTFSSDGPREFLDEAPG